MSIDIPGMGTADWLGALDNLDLLAAPVAASLTAVAEREPDLAAQAVVAAIDPEFADTDAMTARHPRVRAVACSCVRGGGKRGGRGRTAAAVVRATAKADVNHVIKRLLNVRKASFWPQERAVEASGMEYGGITPVGVPEGWRLLLDTRVVEGFAVIGSGLRSSKLALPGELLARLPGAEVVEGLATE